ncbi:hypothetical protein J4H86_18300 [Spiractinospora alimapuensis]|uniref:hypothetical protein n=1 Tax=Spiractinospora alimapuensis TaxID=2820884 RepID=UPI001F356ADD|nr:hypothetical protein [Spiractinospora alimapuensis]QVQ50808.1 hypothetical protein J4H86_18300 [Spiractinospora alimapuensis]
MTSKGPHRSVRAGVFASVSVGVSAAGHSLASQQSLPPVALLVGLAALFACGWGFAGKERGLGAICGWMVWGQLALHIMFSLAQSASTHVHGAPPSDVGGGQTGVDMMVVHVVAALVSGWWLRRGEAGLFHLLHLLGAALLSVLALFGLLGPVEVHRTPGRVVVPPDPCRPAPSRVLRYALILRGPPLTLAA